jgi:hypothetical protein
MAATNAVITPFLGPDDGAFITDEAHIAHRNRRLNQGDCRRSE